MSGQHIIGLVQFVLVQRARVMDNSCLYARLLCLDVSPSLLSLVVSARRERVTSGVIFHVTSFSTDRTCSSHYSLLTEGQCATLSSDI